MFDIVNVAASISYLTAVYFISTAGDDRRILLWNMVKALTSSETPTVPVMMKAEHNSNVFCMAFDCNDQLIISGGNDACIIVHDMTR